MLGILVAPTMKDSLRTVLLARGRGIKNLTTDTQNAHNEDQQENGRMFEKHLCCAL